MLSHYAKILDFTDPKVIAFFLARDEVFVSDLVSRIRDIVNPLIVNLHSRITQVIRKIHWILKFNIKLKFFAFLADVFLNFVELSGIVF